MNECVDRVTYANVFVAAWLYGGALQGVAHLQADCLTKQDHSLCMASPYCCLIDEKKTHPSAVLNFLLCSI